MKTLERKYTLNNNSIKIEVPIFEQDERMVMTAKFRRNINTIGNIEIEPNQVSEKNEFFNDIENQIKFLQGKQIDKQSMFEALYDSCSNHVKKYGKLIDIDLLGYLDCSMFIAEAISVAFKWTPISQQLGEELRDEFSNGAIKVLYNHIWINQKDHNDPSSKPQIIKLSEMK